MTSIELPDEVAAALAAAAADRGLTEAEFIAAIVVDPADTQGLDGFVGCIDSGDPEWAATDSATLRRAADTAHTH